MSVILQPCRQTVSVADFTEASDEIVGNAVGNQTTEIPKEAVGPVRTSYHDSLQGGQVRDRVIFIFLFKGGQHIICPVLSSGFIAVLYHYFEGRTIFGRDAAENFSYVSVEMGSNMLFTHFIYFQSSSFRTGRRISDPGRTHGCPYDGPFARRNLPVEFPIFKVRSDVCYLFRVYQHILVGNLRLLFPHIVMPHWQRILEHFGKCLFRITFYYRLGG